MHRSASAPDLQPPALRPAEAGVSVAEWPPAAGSARRGCRARGSPTARGAPPRATPRTGRSRRVSRSRGRAPIPASRSARAGPMPSARSRSVVGHRHTVDRLAPSVTTSASVRWVAWTALKRSPSSPCRSSRPTGVTPYAATHCSFSAGCSETWQCNGTSRSAAHAPTTSADAGSTARTEWIAAPTPRRRRCQPVEVRGARRPPERIAVAEAPLNRIQLDPDAAVQVTGVEQRDANAGRRGGGDQRRAHRVRVVIVSPTHVMVDVVELADAGDAGERHLTEHRRREPVVRLRRQVLGRRVHLLAPRPERADADLGGTPQQPVEGVTVGVGESRQGEAREAGRGRRRFGDGWSHRRDAITIDVDRNTGGDGVAAEPRQLAPVARRHEPTRRTNSVIRLTNASR